MATYIELRKKAFDKQLQLVAKSTYLTPKISGVRRPLDGIVLKPETHAFIRVLTEDGWELPLFGVNESGSPYSNFVVFQWQPSDTEKFQIVDTFGEDYLYFFGRKPRSYALSGWLLNTADFHWRGEWWKNYSDYLRGSKLAEMRARAYMYIDGAVIEGYFIGSTVSGSADNNNIVQFSTTMLVTDYIDTTSYFTSSPRPQEMINQEGDRNYSDIELTKQKKPFEDKTLRKLAAGAMSLVTPEIEEQVSQRIGSIRVVKNGKVGKLRTMMRKVTTPTGVTG